jgi:hypothetical protein
MRRRSYERRGKARATGCRDPTTLPAVRASTIALVLANLVPLVGALSFGWSVRGIFALYWSESVVVGGFTVLRFWTARYPDGTSRAAAVLLSLFFCVHFGLFLFVHAAFLMVFFRDPGGVGRDLFFGAPGVLLGEAMRSGGGLGLLALVASHGVSFVTNFLGGERDHAAPGKLMAAPYLRVVAMHVCLIAGGLLLTCAPGGTTDSVLLALLVTAKIAVDILSHGAERRALRAGDGG